MEITNINLGTCPPQYLSIGYRDEYGARPVAFDFSAWATEYGAGVLQLLLQRPGDADPYPVVLDIDGTTATWTPDATDTAAQGQGQAQLVYTVGGVIVKNAIFRVLIAPSLGAAGDPPEPYETWLERLQQLAAETQQNAIDAAGSAEAASAAKNAAVVAQKAAEKARDETVEAAESVEKGLATKVDKSALDDAGIKSRTYSPKFGGAFSVTTVASADYIKPHARATVHGRIDKTKLHRVTVNGTEYVLRTRLWFEGNKDYEYLGNLALYVSDVSGVPGGTDNVPFVIISDLDEPDTIDVLTDAAGTYEILVEVITPSQVLLPISLIWGDAYVPIEKANNSGVYNGFSLGVNELTSKRATFAIGYGNKISGNFSVAIGTGNTVSNTYGVAVGAGNTVSGHDGFAEGFENNATGKMSHAEGQRSEASGLISHAEGNYTLASGAASHTEGQRTIASGNVAHAEGDWTEASGPRSHAEGSHTVANHFAQHVSGQYNVPDPSAAEATERGEYVEIIGNGTADDARSNARTLDWDGNERLAGDLTIHAGGANETVVGAALDALKSDVADTQSMIATVETSETASKNYAIGDLLVLGGTLYKVTAAIPTGATITPGSNVTQTTVEAQIAESGGSGGGSDWTDLGTVTVTESTIYVGFNVPTTAKEIYLEYLIYRVSDTSASYVWVGSNSTDNNETANRIQLAANSVFAFGACNVSIGYDYVSSIAIAGTKTSIPTGQFSSNSQTSWVSTGAKRNFDLTGTFGVKVPTGIDAGSKVSLRYR